MHIQKLLAMISAGAIFGAGSLQAQSVDNDIQAKAREALRQKMAELGSQPAATNSPAPAAPTVPVPPTAPVTPPPPAAPVAPAVTPKADTKAFEQTGQLPPPAVMVTPPKRVSKELQAQALEALRQKKAELDAQEPVVTPTPTVAAVAPMAPIPTPAPITVVKSAPAVDLHAAPPTPAPVPVLSGSKEQRLDELLQLYKTDRITPAEYHQQRAKIIAEP